MGAWAHIARGCLGQSHTVTTPRDQVGGRGSGITSGCCSTKCAIVVHATCASLWRVAVPSKVKPPLRHAGRCVWNPSCLPHALSLCQVVRKATDQR